MTPFRKYPRAWCELCGARVLAKWLHGEVCRDCGKWLWELDERDAERRSLKGYTDSELERI
jgi:hypothetical protein